MNNFYDDSPPITVYAPLTLQSCRVSPGKAGAEASCRLSWPHAASLSPEDQLPGSSRGCSLCG